MESKDCIIIESDNDDEEGEDNANYADVSVQVIEEHVKKKKEEKPDVKCKLDLDASVIDLTDESFRQTVPPLEPILENTNSRQSPNGDSPIREPTPTLLTPSPLTPPPPTQTESPPLFPSSPSSSTSSFSSPPRQSSTPPLFQDSASCPTPSSLAPSRQRQRQSSSISPQKRSPKLADQKAAREEAKRQKLKQKEEEKLIKEANRANAANKALQNCTAILDKNILKIINDEDEVAFRTLFDESMLSYRFTEYPKFENSIIWNYKRTEVEEDKCVTKFKDADWILIVMKGDEYLKRALAYTDDPESEQSIKTYICDIRRRSKCDVIIIVHELANYLKTERAKEAKNYRKTFKDRFEGNNNDTAKGNEQSTSIASIGATDLQDLRLMFEIELKHQHPDWKMHIEFYEKTQEIVQTIVRYTSSIAKLEVKRRIRSESELDWAINMDKEKAVDPTKSSEDLTKLWITQLQQFSQITLPIAKAIAAEYPSPSALLDQYKVLSTTEAEDLLAELYVQRNLKRQIGPNISRKVHCFMTCRDPNVHIGYG